MASKPTIPERFSSLGQPSDPQDVANAAQRSVSAKSAISQLSATSSTSDFVDAKIESITADIELDRRYKGHLVTAKKRKALSSTEYYDAMKGVMEEIHVKEEELGTLKRHKKAILDDLDEMSPHHSKTEAAYASIMVTKIMSASKQQLKVKKKTDQREFSERVLSYYCASRESEGYEEKYCHLMGWLPSRLIKCAHLVPKSLESKEIAYLFGSHDAILSEPRNGITLNHIVEGGLDSGWIVLVPDKPNNEQETIWRCVLVDQSHANNVILPGTKWSDLDGKALEFLSENRPARRYLYLRYVITFLHQQSLGNIEWCNRVQARGYLWATPGKYLRKSMLVALARQASDHFLPEAFYDLTFEDTESSQQRSEKEEDELAIDLDYKLKGVLDGKARKDEAEDSEDDSDSDSESD